MSCRCQWYRYPYLNWDTGYLGVQPVIAGLFTFSTPHSIVKPQHRREYIRVSSIVVLKATTTKPVSLPSSWSFRCRWRSHSRWKALTGRFALCCNT
eukprot:1614044-Rhodomonas_salina.2